jgi:hypothetical protein
VCHVCVCVCLFVCVMCFCVPVTACLFMYVICVCHVCVHQVEQYITGAENTSIRLGMLMEVCSTHVKEICNTHIH